MTALLLTIGETMRALRIGKRKYYELVSAGRIHPVELGPKTTRVSVAELQQLIRELTPETATAGPMPRSGRPTNPHQED